MRKHVLFFLITFSFYQIGISQTCYSVIADFTGLDNSSYVSQIETASCELKNALPTEFQNDFKVFDFGFYSLSENMQGGFQTVWDNKVIPETTIRSKYYLLFGKQLHDSKGKSKLWVKTNLPNEGSFNCFTTTQFNLLENTLSAIGNNKLSNGINFYESELEVLNKLKTRILSMIECCSSNINRSVCSTCPSNQDIELFYSSNGFEVDEIKIIKENGLALQRVPSQSTNVLNFSNLIYNFEGNTTDPQAQVESLIESMNSDGRAKGIIIDNSSLCADPTQPSFRSSSTGNEAVALFNSGFEINGVDTRLVFHLFDEEDGSKPDKLYRNYLYAYKGILESSNLELSPTGVAPYKETQIESILTSVNNCTSADTLLEVTKNIDEDVYYSYKLENCNWVKRIWLCSIPFILHHLILINIRLEKNPPQKL
ncbi:MAG: hypothetical protein IPK46_02470 [Saprospiraceae bacterium]|nr:hypothetical protein [Saprospiraceae bacterium]